MRQGRAPSRGATRTKTTSPSPNLGNGILKKSTKLPQIAGVIDENISGVGAPGQQASGLVVGVCSQQGKRPYQEDEYSVRLFLNQSSPQQESDVNVETHFFGLFDGHAGGRCSNYVAGSLANVLAEDSSFFTNLPQALKRSYHQTNEMFLKVAEKMKYHDGSTGITAVVRDSKVLVANVGDCRCLIISGGRPIQMSIDQKPTNPEEQKRIASLGGTVVYCMGVARVNRVLAVSRAFGNRTLRSVIRPDAEMMQRELTREDDYIVMASDGLWDVLKNKDVCDMCYSQFTQGDPQAIADELVQSALMRGSMDNVTCIVVKLTDYVARLFNNRAGAGLGASANSSLPSAAANAAGQNQVTSQQLFNNNNNAAAGPIALERASSLKIGSNGSQRGGGPYEQSGGAGGAFAQQGAAGSSGLLPLARQYSTGSIGNNNNGQAPQLMPALDNFLYSPNRGAAAVHFPPTSSQNGRSSPGIASLRQHMNREGSFNYEDEDNTTGSGNSGSGNSWGASPGAGAGGGAGSVSGHQNSGFGGGTMAYAARRPNTMGGNLANALGGGRSAMAGSMPAGGMPNLISMFNNTVPHGSNVGTTANVNALAPLPASSPLASTSSGAGGSVWNSDSDYSGHSYGSESSSGSRAATSHGGFQARSGPLGMFPSYKRAPYRK